MENPLEFLDRSQIPYLIVLGLAIACIILAAAFHRYRK
jgi:hypothetical protein